MPNDEMLNWAERKLRALEPTRREMLIRSGQVAAFLGLSSVAGARGAFAQSGEVVWLQQEGVSDPAFLKGFTAATVKPVAITSESAAAAQVLGGQLQGDVTLVSQGYGKNFWFADDVVEVLDPANLPHWGDLYEYWQNHPLYHDAEGKLRAVPHIWGTDSLIHSTAYAKEIDSLAALFDPANEGKIGMPMNSIEAVAVAGQYLGVKEPFAPTDEELAAIKDALLKQKPLVRTYWETIGDLVNLFTSGEVTLAYGWLAVYTLVKEAGVDVAWANPKEGQIGWSNGNGVLKSSTQKELGTQFVDYLISPDYLLPLYQKLGYRTCSKVVTDSLTPEQRTALQLDDPEAVLANITPWITPPSELNRKIDDLWAEVVAS
jgi:spermidine/putrescine-binding protein